MAALPWPSFTVRVYSKYTNSADLGWTGSSWAAILPAVSGNQEPNVYEHADNQRSLADRCRSANAEECGFSYRAFSQRAGIRFTHYLKLS